MPDPNSSSFTPAAAPASLAAWDLEGKKGDVEKSETSNSSKLVLVRTLDLGAEEGAGKEQFGGVCLGRGEERGSDRVNPTNNDKDEEKEQDGDKILGHIPVTDLPSEALPHISHATPPTPPHSLSSKNTPIPSSSQSPPFSTLLRTSQPWTFHRTLTSRLPTQPSGTVTGTATFTPFTPRSSNSPATATTATTEEEDAEEEKQGRRKEYFHYTETGTFTTTTGIAFDIRQKYIYIFTPKHNTKDEKSNDKMAIYFPPTTTTSGSNSEIGALFVQVGAFALVEKSSSSSPFETTETVYKARNKERHLCGGGFVRCDLEMWWWWW